MTGAAFLTIGCGLTLSFSTATSMTTCFWVFFVVGLGMEFVTLSTLLVVQSCLSRSDLGVATSSHQFARTLGGTVGIGVCGGLVASRLAAVTDSLQKSGLPEGLMTQIRGNTEILFSADLQARVAPELQRALQQTVLEGVSLVFWVTLGVSLLCLVLCALLPGEKGEVVD